jgi:hypothetical protein
MVIIKTKVLGPTDTRGTRIKATANKMSVIIPYPYKESFEKAHFEAVKELVTAFNLTWDISNMGFGSDDNGYYFTFKHSVMGA